MSPVHARGPAGVEGEPDEFERLLHVLRVGGLAHLRGGVRALRPGSLDQPGPAVEPGLIAIGVVVGIAATAYYPSLPQPAKAASNDRYQVSVRLLDGGRVVAEKSQQYP